VEGAEAEKKAKEAVEAMAKETVTNPSVGKLADSYFNLLMPSTTLNLLKATASSFHRYYFIVPPQERKIWLSPPELMNRQLWYFLHSKFSKFIFNKKPKEGERFVFFPLHFSQDAALKAVNPLADQVRLVEDISKVLPHGTYLYVKPHPHWKCSDLNIKDMLRLNKLPNVRPLDYHASTRDMIRDCVYVIIINSSVGHEALVQKKKVLSFGCGYPADVIPRIADPEELKGADNIEMDWDKCRDYIANVYHHAIFHTDQKKYNVGAWNREFAEALLKEMLSAYEYMKPKR
ncbi:TPA: hypothetical protein EYP38_04425, partial [Candidatus Micrarchaeota archaeon]|nr:hypothetical protein [Candidatus Micrarchaeota archaeon]